MKKLTRDETEHGQHYYSAAEVDALLAQLSLPEQPEQEPDDMTIAYLSGLHDGKKNALG